MSATGSKAVFLSYAREDSAGARRIAGALRASGVEVWFDEDELRGGDAWDAKIRRQIATCALFVPIISASTQARAEGYFRREWRSAAERMRDMADDAPFLVPVVIDDTPDARARVPECFRDRQWTRLPNGDCPAEFCARILALLGGDAGTGMTASPLPGAPQPAPPRRGSQPSRRAAKVRILVAMGTLTLVALAWMFWPRTEARDPGATSAPAETAAQREARTLVAKAWEQMNRPGAYRAELEIAEDLCRRAAVLDPDSADAWAAWSHVDCWHLYHVLDTSDVRREAARTKSARAIKLDPKSFEARFAEANYLVRGPRGSTSGVAPAQAESVAMRLRDLLAERTNEPRVWFALAILLRNSGKIDESADAFDRMAATPEFAATAKSEKGWMFWQRRDWGAAVRACDESIALQPFRGNLLLRIYLALSWLGDLDLAQATLARTPSQLRLEDDFVAIGARIHWWRRESAEMRRLLTAIPRSFITWGHTPKDYLLGEAFRLDGEEEAARASWASALRETDAQVARSPSGLLDLRRARLLALIGRRDEARQLLRLSKAAGLPIESPIFMEFRDWSIPLSNGDIDEALDSLEKGYNANNSWAATWAMLRYNPVLDPLRDHPRFKELLARAEVDPQRNPHAKGKSVAIAPAPSPEAKSIAVLAFENRSSEKDSEYFSDGISEELLNVLAKVPGLKVLGRSSSFQFKGRNEPPQEVGRKLNVTYLVEGSVQRSGTQARIIERLLRADNGEQIWSDGFNSELKDILVAQQDIARAIAERLAVAFGTGPRARPVSPEAHRLVLQGRYFVARRWAGFEQAAEAFTAAVKVDPNFAPAHAGLAEVNMLHGLYIMADGRGPVDDKFAQAKSSARRAMELDPSLAEPHATLGLLLFMERQWAEAERHFQETFRLNPNNGMAYHWHGLLLGVVGKLDRALEALARSVDLDPLGHTSFFTYGGYLVAAGRFAESLEAMDRGLPMATGAATLPVYHSIRAVALHHLGRTEEAVASARLVRQLPRGPSHTPHWWADGDAIYVLHRTGHAREAEEYLREVQRNAGSRSYIYGYALCGLGRFDEGVPLLASADPMCQSKLYFMPMFESLHGTPRFQEVFAQLNSTPEYKRSRETIVRLRRGEPKK